MCASLMINEGLEQVGQATTQLQLKVNSQDSINIPKRKKNVTRVHAVAGGSPVHDIAAAAITCSLAACLLRCNLNLMVLFIIDDRFI